jgi:putative dimethyl sulfoxide reductase chaperone
MQSLQQHAQQRAALYALASRLMLIEVDKPFLEQLEADPALLDLFPNYRSWQKRQELDMKDLVNGYYNVDFANLFLMHLVPYESFYTREDQMIESGGENPVIALYNDLDFRVNLSEARVVSADHIGVELEFMYRLCEAQIKAIEADDEAGLCEVMQAQRTFLKEHLLEWAPMFLINVKKESRTPLYHDGAEFVLEFLLSDFEYLTEQLVARCTLA